MADEATAVVAAAPALEVAAPVVAAVVAAPAPVVTATPVVVAAPTVDGPAPFAYEPSGDAALDVAMDFVGRLGFGPTSPGVAAALKGDFAPLEAALAALGDKAKGYERMVALGRQAYAQSQANANAVTTKVNAAVFDVAGGKDQWTAIQTWASANADPGEKESINAMFKAGPVQARAAALMLKGAYDKAQGTVVTPKAAVKADATGGGVAPTATGPISQRDYAAAAQQLHNKYGSQMTSQPEYHQLNARYLAGRKQ